MAPTPAPGLVSVGQETAARLARRALTSGGTPPTLLVLGPPGMGIDAFVDDVLATALCDGADPPSRPCHVCPGCYAARSRSHPDLVMASPERWREDRGSGESIVAAARRWLLDTAGAPVQARWRVVLIESADDASEEIQNALLKAIEEPSGRQVFVLTARDAGRLLPTVRSRSQVLRMRPVPTASLAAWLVEHEHVTDDQARALARLAGGELGQAAALARAPAQVDWRRRTQLDLLALLDRGPAERLGAVRDLLDSVAAPDDPTRSPAARHRLAADAVLAAWCDLSRDLALAAAGMPSLAVAAELVGDLGSAAASASAAQFGAAALALDRLRIAVRENVSPRLVLEMAMLTWPSRTGRPAGAPAPSAS